jgi:hypothetical protein
VTNLDHTYWYQPGVCGLNRVPINHSFIFTRDVPDPVDPTYCDFFQGDSGSPFYFQSSTSPAQVQIRGMGTALLSDHSLCFGMNWVKIRDALGVVIAT